MHPQIGGDPGIEGIALDGSEQLLLPRLAAVGWLCPGGTESKTSQPLAAWCQRRSCRRGRSCRR